MLLMPTPSHSYFGMEREEEDITEDDIIGEEDGAEDDIIGEEDGADGAEDDIIGEEDGAEDDIIGDEDITGEEDIIIEDEMDRMAIKLTRSEEVQSVVAQ